MTQTHRSLLPLRVFVATRAADVPEEARPFVAVDGTVEGCARRYDHHVTEELTNLDALPERFEPGELHGIATPWADTDAVISAAVLLAGGTQALIPAHREVLESAAHWCDHLGPHPELSDADNDAGRALYDALGGAIAHAPPEAVSATFEELAQDLATRLLQGEALPSADTRDAQTRLAAALRDSGRVRVVTRARVSVALVNLTDHPPIAPVALYGAVQADVVVRYEELAEGGYRYAIGVHPSGETPPDLRPVLRALAEREVRTGSPAKRAGIEPDAENWGGRAAAGGSPRNYASRITPDDALRVVLESTSSHHRVFTEALLRPTAENFERAREKMRGVLRRKIALKRLTPESLGYQGSSESEFERLAFEALSWSMTGGCRVPSAEEIRAGARVPKIFREALDEKDIDGLVLSNVERFLARRMREAKPEEYRVFKVVEETLEWACERGLLQAIGRRRRGRADTEGAIRGSTWIFAPNSANVPIDEGREVEFWCDHLPTVAPGWKGLCVRIRDSFSERARERLALRVVQVVGIRYRFRVDALVSAVLMEVRRAPDRDDRDALERRLEDLLDHATRVPTRVLARCDALARSNVGSLEIAPESEVCRAQDEGRVPFLARLALDDWKSLIRSGAPELPDRIRRRLDDAAGQRAIAMIARSLELRSAVAVVGFVTTAFVDLAGEPATQEPSALRAMAAVYRHVPAGARPALVKDVVREILRRGGKRGRPERLRSLWRALTSLWDGRETAVVTLPGAASFTLDAEAAEHQDALREAMRMKKQTLSDDLQVLRDMLIGCVKNSGLAANPAAGDHGGEDE